MSSRLGARDARNGTGGDFGSDYSALSAYVETLETAISSMSPPLQRGEASREQVRNTIMRQDTARSEFLKTGLDQVYRRLTRNLADHLPIAELCARAAESYPALLPGAGQMAAERALPLNKKEGRELSLATFISAVFRDQKFGRHLLDSMRRPSPEARDHLSEYSKRGRLDLGSVAVERRGAGAVITLENGACLNAEDLELLTQLELAVDIVLLSPDTRVGVVRGGVMTHPKYRGRRIFCAGINLRKLASGEIPVVEYLISREAGLIEKIRRGLSLGQDGVRPSFCYEKPWVGAVEGFAIGGGFQLLLNFDKVIASDEAFFSLPAAQEGIVPGSANFRLPRIVGSKLARRMILFGEKVYAAGENGRLLCDEVVDLQSVDAAIDVAIGQLSGDAVVANRHMMNISDEPEDQLLHYLSEFSQVQAERYLSKDVIDRVGGW